MKETAAHAQTSSANASSHGVAPGRHAAALADVGSVGWGSGTKLPHNISALLGVKNGAASDLRAGLPWQMVEIHEPVRLLIIIVGHGVAPGRVIAGLVSRLARASGVCGDRLKSAGCGLAFAGIFSGASHTR